MTNPQRIANDELERQVFSNINDFGWHALNVIEDDGHPPWTFTIGFYALPFGEGSGFGTAWGTFAAINFVTWLPLLYLMWKGEEIRARQGTPNLHKDL